LTQFVTPDDEHDVLETRRELINKNKYMEKNCVSRWSFTMNHYMKHGQQNIKNVPYCVVWVSIPPEAINYLSLKLSVAIQFVDLSSYKCWTDMVQSAVLCIFQQSLTLNKFVSLSSEILWEVWQV
jgi:hypothetical protein